MCHNVRFLDIDLKLKPTNYGADAVQWPSISFTGRLLLAIKSWHCVRIQLPVLPILYRNSETEVMPMARMKCEIGFGGVGRGRGVSQ
jgi:hypothetical protein